MTTTRPTTVGAKEVIDAKGVAHTSPGQRPGFISRDRHLKR